MNQDLILRGIEQELVNGAPDRPESYAQPQHRLPAGVEHAPGVPQVGALTAEATLSQYQDLVKSVEAVGTVLNDVVARCRAVEGDALGMAADLKAFIAKIQECAKAEFELIQTKSIQLDQMRETIDALRSNIGT